MVPVVELRFGLPYGIALGLEYPCALAAAVLGNLLPAPFIIVFVRRVFAWLRRKNARFDDWITGMEHRANLKGEMVKKYGPIGLCLLVAIPLPGTGAWTGALVAALLDLGFVRSMLYIILGVLIAAGIMTLLTYGALAVF
ncbi:MAG: small multi-drug export protein [Oscillospiraceae bacterium]|nr:small multi-drug export protein [Oscillospiraceae bacterium]